MSSCRWLNIVGMVAVTAGALLLLAKGKLPFPFWFLFAAVVVGLLDVIKGQKLLSFPGELPTPRFDLATVTPVPGEAGRKVEFEWTPWESTTGDQGSLTAAFTISDAEYSAAKGLLRYPRAPIENYAHYPREQFKASIQQVAAFFRKHSETHGFSPLGEMANIVCFVRSIRYAPDQETRNQSDWANFAVETLYDSAGDCEDHGILAAALLHYLGHSVALFYLNLEDSGHIALGFECLDGGGPFFAIGADGRSYYYVETVPTSASERIGVINEEFLIHLKEWKVLLIASGQSSHS